MASEQNSEKPVKPVSVPIPAGRKGDPDSSENLDLDLDTFDENASPVHGRRSPPPLARQVSASSVLEEAYSSSGSDLISLDKLHELRIAFELADVDGGGGLDMDEFVKAFGHILGDNLSQHQLTRLFMKIDANSDGSVDWPEFTEYMLLENKGTELMKKEDIKCEYISQDFEEPHENYHQHHARPIIRVRNIPALGAYATCSEDGSVRLWQSFNHLTHIRTVLHDPTVPIQSMRKAAAEREGRAAAAAAASEAKTLNLSKPSGKPKKSKVITREPPCPTQYFRAAGPAWINDCCYMHQSSKLALATGDRTIAFYETTMAFDCVGRIHPLASNPVLLDYYHGPLSEFKEVLVSADDSGYVHIWHLEPNQWHFADTNIDIPSRVRLPRGVNRYFQLRAHEDRITQLKIDVDIGAIMTCGSDGAIHLIDIEKRRILRSFCCHTKAVYDFIFIPRLKLIASAGIERRILFWNPYTCAIGQEINNPEEVTAPIQSVHLNEREHQLITLNTSNEVHIWDLTTFSCTQYIHCGGSDEKKLSGMIFDESKQRIVLYNRTLHIRQAKVIIPTEQKSHQFPVTQALFNSGFHQLVSAAAFEVHVWDVYSGRLNFRFLHPHGDSHVTSMCFDVGGRRLFTGSHNGSIKVWNFNTGACLGDFLKTRGGEAAPLLAPSSSDQEITSIACFTDVLEGNGFTVENTYIVATGWDRRVFFFSEKQKDSNINEYDLSLPLPRHVEKAHLDDINRVIYCGHNTIATAGDDGRILTWSLSSGFLKYRLGHSPAARRLLKPGAFEHHIAGAARRQLLYSLLTHERSKPAKASKNASLQDKISPRSRTAIQRAVDKPKSSLFEQFSSSSDDRNKEVQNDEEEKDIGTLRKLIRQSTIGDPSSVSQSQKAAVADLQSSKFLFRRASELGGLAKEKEIRSIQEEAAMNKKREQMRNLPKPDRLAVEGLIFLERLQCIVSSGADGFIRFWDHLEGKLLFEIDAQSAAPESIGALATDTNTNAYLFSGDTQGEIKVWDLCGLHLNTLKKSSGLKLSTPLHKWRAHQEAIANIQYIRWSEGVQGSIELIVTSSTDCTLMLWTLDGSAIGMFGQNRPWSLGSVLSWARKKSLIIHRAKNLSDVLSTFHSHTPHMKMLSNIDQQNLKRKEDTDRDRELDEVDNFNILHAKTKNRYNLNYISDVDDRKRFLAPDPNANMSAAQQMLMLAAKSKRQGPREFPVKPSHRAQLQKQQIMHRMNLPQLDPIVAPRTQYLTKTSSSLF